ncbi:hypothetical protein PAXINDRAFT_170111 [Paxillus involutus ATCC 200175]|uniref:Uncharacterized protein n=1 Tax=Paxillus involutus ATCC 200175 TaxID=664439 RepID=A0A0C9U2I0_PAXIN|nr:hypothetical protein PAXINDRAFT_170111 [Paxillus involutus ATCC 200175]
MFDLAPLRGVDPTIAAAAGPAGGGSKRGIPDNSLCAFASASVGHLQGRRVTLLLHYTLQVFHWLNKP